MSTSAKQQLDADLEFARRLQAEINGEVYHAPIVIKDEKKAKKPAAAAAPKKKRAAETQIVKPAPVKKPTVARRPEVVKAEGILMASAEKTRRMLLDSLFADDQGKCALEPGYNPPSDAHADLHAELIEMQLKFLQDARLLIQERTTDFVFYNKNKK
jgi:hypothetical protein